MANPSSTPTSSTLPDSNHSPRKRLSRMSSLKKVFKRLTHSSDDDSSPPLPPLPTDHTTPSTMEPHHTDRMHTSTPAENSTSTSAATATAALPRSPAKQSLDLAANPPPRRSSLVDPFGQRPRQSLDETTNHNTSGNGIGHETHGTETKKESSFASGGLPLGHSRKSSRDYSKSSAPVEGSLRSKQLATSSPSSVQRPAGDRVTDSRLGDQEEKSKLEARFLDCDHGNHQHRVVDVQEPKAHEIKDHQYTFLKPVTHDTVHHHETEEVTKVVEHHRHTHEVQIHELPILRPRKIVTRARVVVETEVLPQPRLGEDEASIHDEFALARGDEGYGTVLLGGCGDGCDEEGPYQAYAQAVHDRAIQLLTEKVTHALQEFNATLERNPIHLPSNSNDSNNDDDHGGFKRLAERPKENVLVGEGGVKYPVRDLGYSTTERSTQSPAVERSSTQDQQVASS